MIFFPSFQCFSSPEPRREHHRIYPLFLPFSGCRKRCVFCAQDVQTGRNAGSVSNALEQADRALREQEKKSGPAFELAFFGGTFTALAPDDFRACLDFTVRWMERGLIHRARCSTRPDALAPSRLASLKAAGFSLVELGVQSFSDKALIRSQRGYNADAARKGCELTLASGLELGIQLMPGMPGSTPETARRDVEEAADIAPSCARLYPCVVLEGTPLARIWRQGGFVPWTLERTLDFLAPACLAFWRAGTPVIRIGLVPEAGLEKQLLAGPQHPALGGMAKSRALYLYLREQVEVFARAGGASPVTEGAKSADSPLARAGGAFVLHAPLTWQGAFWGERSALEPAYAAIGLFRKNIRWWTREDFALSRDCAL